MLLFKVKREYFKLKIKDAQFFSLSLVKCDPRWYSNYLAVLLAAIFESFYDVSLDVSAIVNFCNVLRMWVINCL